MKKHLLSIIAILTFISVHAQNLVPNPWFENYISCPTTTTNPVSPLTIPDWFLPTRSTSDYFNVCNNLINGIVGVAVNNFGKQVAASGAGYMGMIVYNNSSADYREYISCKLTAAMTPGVQYSVSMKVSLAEYFSSAGFDGLGMCFFTDTLHAYYDTTAVRLPFAPQVSYSHYGAITDTLNWVTLKDTFQADSAYQYLIVGAFMPKANLQFQHIRTGNPFVYYYVDNVIVAPLGTEPEEPAPTAVNDVSPGGPGLSPNPVTDKAILRLPGGVNTVYTFTLIDIMGQTVWQRSGAGGEEVIFERGSLPAGLYGYRVSREGQVVGRGKVILK